VELITIADFKHYTQTVDQRFSIDGAQINIPNNTIITNPIIILYEAPLIQEKYHITPQNHIVIGNNSKVNIIEIYLNKQQSIFSTKAQTIIQVQDNAQLSYTILQQANTADQQNLIVQIQQQTDSQVNSQIFSYGGKINQITLQATIAGYNATCNIHALGYSKQTENHYLNLQIIHTHSASTSAVNIRSVLDDHAKCSVHGKILVARNAPKIKANLQHKTILLSEHAEIESKPQLEIYNDDVICTHGSSIGELDLNALLYMNTRGISTIEAKQLLLQGFIAPNIDVVQCTNFRQQIKQLFCPEVFT